MPIFFSIQILTNFVNPDDVINSTAFLMNILTSYVLVTNMHRNVMNQKMLSLLNDMTDVLEMIPTINGTILYMNVVIFFHYHLKPVPQKS